MKVQNLRSHDEFVRTGIVYEVLKVLREAHLMDDRHENVDAIIIHACDDDNRKHRFRYRKNQEVDTP